MHIKSNTFNSKKFLPYLILLACLFSANLLLAVNTVTAKPFPNQEESEATKETGKKSRYNFSLFQFISLDVKHSGKSSNTYRNTLIHRKDSLAPSALGKND